MNDFVTFNKALFESMKETLTGGKEAERDFFLRQKLKSQTYQTLVSFWTSITRELDRTDNCEDSSEEFEEAKRRFYREMIGVFKQFKKGENYNRMGMIERFGNKAGEIFHKNVFGGSDSYRKEIEYEFEQFWNNFFKLKGSPIERQRRPKEEIVSDSIATLGSTTIKEAISSAVHAYRQDEEEDKQERGSGFSIQAALDKELESESIFIETEESEDAAQKVSEYIGSNWIKFLAENLAEQLSDGRMMNINQEYKNEVYGTFILGNAYSTYLCAGNYKALYMLIKESGRHPELILKYAPVFEGPTGIEIIDRKEDKSFFDTLITASEVEPRHNHTYDDFYKDVLMWKKGMVHAMTEKVRRLANYMITADGDMEKIDILGKEYFAKVIPIFEGIQSFRNEFAEIELDDEIERLLEELDHPLFYELWLSKPHWANQKDDYKRARASLTFRLNQSFKSMELMMKKATESLKRPFEGGEVDYQKLGEEISDRSVTAIAYMVLEEFERQFRWILERAIALELQFKRRELLSDPMEDIVQTVSEQTAISIRYRLASVSHESSIGKTRGKKPQETSLAIFKCLASIPSLDEKIPKKKGKLKPEEVNGVKTARIYLDQYFEANHIDLKAVEKLCDEFKITIATFLRKQLKVQLEFYYPGSVSVNEFDPDVNYDISTFKGLLGSFLRNVTDIIEREKYLTNN